MQGRGNWKNLWESKASSTRQDDILEYLIKMNGFDTGCGDYSTAQWEFMTRKLCEVLRIDDSSKVLEVGCGSGALLHGIQNHSRAQVFGYDFSLPHIDTANRFVKGQFRVGDATTNPFDSILFDCTISHSVFQYFPDEKYALKTIKTMFDSLSAGGRIALLDINDADFEETYHSVRREAYENPTEYDSKYQDYPHLFLNKNRVVSWLRNLGFIDIEFVPHSVAEYGNSRFRFNIIATKK